MDILTIYLIKTLILPPTVNLLAITATVFTRRRWPRASRVLFGIAFFSLLLLAFPIISVQLARPLETIPPIDLAQGPQGAEAIVVLGGGRYADAPEYGDRDTVHQRTLARLRFGARLAERLDLPVAVVGGDLSGGHVSEGRLMVDVMRESFKTPVRWVETSSRNTAENAFYARKLLAVDRIILVTNAMHMIRSRMMFEQAGFDVLPAPIEFTAYPEPGPPIIYDFIPSTAGLIQAHAALHEYLGIFWYRWRYGGADTVNVTDYEVTNTIQPKIQ